MSKESLLDLQFEAVFFEKVRPTYQLLNLEVIKGDTEQGEGTAWADQLQNVDEIFHILEHRFQAYRAWALRGIYIKHHYYSLEDHTPVWFLRGIGHDVETLHSFVELMREKVEEHVKGEKSLHIRERKAE